MKEPTISVIVPVYNAERYLKRCVDSILAQTYSDFELLLIDDGSKDSSGTICDEYASKDSRVRVYHKSNGGVSDARNFGMNNAQGKWIGFADADDWLELDMYEKMMGVAQLEGADLVMTEFTRHKANGVKAHAKMPEYDGDMKKFIHSFISSGWTGVWDLLIQKRLIDQYKIRFDRNIKIGEDFVFVMSLLLVSKKFVLLREQLYNYECENEDSALHNLTFDTYKETTNAILATSNFYKANKGYAEFEKDFNWKILKGKQELVLYPDKHREFLTICPESHRFILSNPFVGKKIKVMMYMLTHHLRPIVVAYNYIRMLRPSVRQRRRK